MHAIAPLLLNVLLLILHFKKKSPFFAFYGALVVVFSLPHLYHSVMQELDFRDSVYWMATAHAVVFFSVSLLATLVLESKNPTRINRLPDPLAGEDGDLIRNHYLSFSFLLLFLLLTLAAFNFNIVDLIYSNWVDFRSEDSILKLLGSFFLFPGAAFFLISIKKKSIAGYIIVATTLFFIVFGLKSRNYSIALFAPVLIYSALFSRWNFTRLLIFSVLITLVISIYSLTRSVRHVGNVSDLMGTSSVEFDTGEFELIKSFYYVIDHEGVKGGVEFGNFLRLLLLPFPSSVLPFEKPRDLSMVLWDEKTGVSGLSGSLHPTAIGDAIANSYYFGAVIYGLFYTLTFRHLNLFYSRPSKYRVLIFSVFSVVSFYLARGAFYNGAIILIFSSLSILLVRFLFRIKFQR